MKIAVLGAGAMGCMFGAKLSKEQDVTIICHRAGQADVINRQGITVFEPDNSCNYYKDHIAASVSGECNDKFDLLIVLTKTIATEDAMAGNRNILTPQTKVLTLQNGGGNAERLEKFVPKENIIIGTTRHNVVNLDIGVVYHSGAGITYMGANQHDRSVDEIVEMFNSSGFETEESSDIRYLIWQKLFSNLSSNSFTAIARAPIKSCINSTNAWYFMEKLICEAIDVARAEGQYFSYYEVLSMVRHGCENVAEGFTSMSQDVLNCRKTEIDSLNGYVVSRAKLYNISTPYNELVLNLIHAIEDTYQYQEMPVKQFSSNDVILKEGQENTALYKIIKGKVELYSHYGENNEYLFGILSEGKYFGMVSALIGKKEPLTAVAYTDTVVIEIPKESHHRFISVNPGNATDLLKMMAHNTELYRINTEITMGESLYTD